MNLIRWNFGFSVGEFLYFKMEGKFIRDLTMRASNSGMHNSERALKYLINIGPSHCISYIS